MLELEYKPNTEDAVGGRTVYFDMDGTIADLYGVKDVFKRLDNNDASPYREATPIPEYVNMMKEFKDMGYRVGIITAGSRFPPNTPDTVKDKMNADTEAAKVDWLKTQGLWDIVDTFQFVPYGTSKYEVADDKTGILVDDEDKVLNTWYSDRIKAVNKNKAIH
jgi:hypothetical protein